VYSFRNYFVSLSVGLGVLGFSGLWSLLHNLNKKSIDLLTYNSLLAFASLFFAIFYQTRISFYTSWLCLTAISRLSHVALIGLLPLRPKRKFLLTIQLLLILILLPLGLRFSSLPLTKTPWLKMSEEVSQINSEVLIYGEPIRRLELFMPLDVEVRIPRNETQFYEEVNNPRWERVYLYGEKHPLHWQALKDNCLWYYEIVKGNSSLNLEVIWNDKYSYCYEVERNVSS